MGSLVCPRRVHAGEMLPLEGQSSAITCVLENCESVSVDNVLKDLLKDNHLTNLFT